jgi:hypothetical protein
MEIKNKNESVQMGDYEQGLAEDEKWKELTNPNKLWEDDPLFKDYHAISTKQKGMAGEYYVSGFMNHKGHMTKGPISSDHDMIIDGYKTEVKFSLAHTKKQKGDKKIGYDCFIINHVATKKDFERLLFMGINPLESCDRVNYKNSLALERSRRRLLWFTKKDFVKYMNSGKNNVFNHQQTGKKGKNDDYMVTNIKAFANLDFVKGYDEW